jgi:hypothetical protein
MHTWLDSCWDENCQLLNDLFIGKMIVLEACGIILVACSWWMRMLVDVDG